MNQDDVTQSHDGSFDRIDILAEEYAALCRAGNAPSVTEFAARYPNDAEAIRAILPSVAMMERLKVKKKRDGEGSGEIAISTFKAPVELGDYRVIREVGRGGMGIVYEAEQLSLGRHVAVKILPRHALLDPKRLQRFHREAQAAARLHHTNIVPVFGVGEYDGLHYLVMQFIDGQGLDRLLLSWKGISFDKTPATTDSSKSRTTEYPALEKTRTVVKSEFSIERMTPQTQGASLPELQTLEHWQLIARIGLQTAEALSYAHAQGVLHRDIKPANLLLDYEGNVWVSDFGLAKLAENDDLTDTGDLIGTLRYMAPERLKSHTDAQSDIYSLGLSLYELLTLEPAIQGSSPSELIQRVSESQPERPRKRNALIPRDLETIVLKAIAREPSKRYASAHDLGEDLRRFLDDRPVLAKRVSPPERLWRWCRRNRALAALGATAGASLLLAALVGCIGYVVTNDALRRSEANVELSLHAIEALFETIASRDFEPFPPGMGPGAGELPPPPPPDDADGRRGPGPRGGPPRSERDRPGGRRPPLPPASPRDRGRNSPRPGPGPGEGESEDEAALIQSVLTFYDEFAAKNATNRRLRREAAESYRRVGDLQRRLGRESQARAAFLRATDLYESVLADAPGSDDVRRELIETYVLTGSRSEERETLEEMERGLTRALAHARRLEPKDENRRLTAWVDAKLGLVIGLQGPSRIEEAQQRIQSAIDQLGKSEEPTFLATRGAIRVEFAEFLASHGRLDEGKTLLNRCAEDLRSLSTRYDRPDIGRWIGPQFERLAEAAGQLGETALAEQMVQEAEAFRPRRHPPDGRGWHEGPDRQFDRPPQPPRD